jgi:uncharacterized phage protein (TIGR01671 family)
MREIKFRAWDKVSKRMLYSYEPEEQGRREYIMVQFGIGFSDWKKSDLEIMQFTGLKDKNGIEIFEADIVRINHPHDITGDFTNAIGEVFWWDEEGGWYHSNNHGRPPKRMWEYVEIIGNMYENPELLPAEEH